MKFDFKVHGVASGQANVRTEVDGEPMTATVPCLEVELVTASERNGNLVLRIVGSSLSEAVALFAKDALIEGEFKAKAKFKSA